jgi:hypothetical protein
MTGDFMPTSWVLPMHARLTQAAAMLLVMPAYVLVMHGLRFYWGYPVEPLIVLAYLYAGIAVILSVGVHRRSRVAWSASTVLAAAASAAALYLGWFFCRALLTGAARAGWALLGLGIFQVIFLASSLASLALLLSQKARKELRGTSKRPSPA